VTNNIRALVERDRNNKTEIDQFPAFSAMTAFSAL
jgi:hypothetical protein